MDMILVAGLWLRATVWETTAAKLTRLGHRPIPLRLPGVDGGSGRDTSGGLAAQLDAVLAAIDHAERPLVVGHSAAAGLAWMAADRRPEAIGGVAMIGGFPPTDGQPYVDGFDLDTNGEIPFPGWGPFEGPDSDDLNETSRAKLADQAVPVGRAVAEATISLHNPARSAVPLAIVCPEFGPEDVQDWLVAGRLPELGRITDVTLLDINTGHWPMLSAPADLAIALDRIAQELTR